MDGNRRYQELAYKWLNNTISKEEKEEFVAWYNSNQDKELLISTDLAANEEEHQRRILERINDAIALTADKKSGFSAYKKLLAVITAAAAMVLMVMAGLFLRYTGENAAGQDTLLKNDIAPGGPRATLTLGNGKTILLDNMSAGDIAEEAGVTISKTADGQIRYQIKETIGQQSGQVTYNTIKTPLGGQYELFLPDGSTVWLNAGSSLTFPSQFKPDARRVELTGEAYFSVNQQPATANGKRGKGIPFIVKTSSQEVYVMGTEFNINAYEDEMSVKTTLVDGSVKVKQLGKDNFTVLKPGQQAQISAPTSAIQVESVNTAAFIAWKNGYFYFHDADILAVLRQFARWYNIEVIYETSPLRDVYVGKIPRSMTLTQALKVLKIVGVNYKIESKKLIIFN